MSPKNKATFGWRVSKSEQVAAERFNKTWRSGKRATAQYGSAMEGEEVNGRKRKCKSKHPLLGYKPNPRFLSGYVDPDEGQIDSVSETTSRGTAEQASTDDSVPESWEDALDEVPFLDLDATGPPPKAEVTRQAAEQAPTAMILQPGNALSPDPPASAALEPLKETKAGQVILSLLAGAHDSYLFAEDKDQRKNYYHLLHAVFLRTFVPGPTTSEARRGIKRCIKKMIKHERRKREHGFDLARSAAQACAPMADPATVQELASDDQADSEVQSILGNDALTGASPLDSGRASMCTSPDDQDETCFNCQPQR